MEQAKLYRQGDVLLRKVSRIPSRADSRKVNRVGGRVVLAEGEVTGHAHAIESALVEMYEVAGRAWIQVDGNESVALEHEEHATILLEPGYYEVVRQREYTPTRDLRVAD